jgi:uncharacterized membrane protein YbhN (UPF0104 family)
MRAMRGRPGPGARLALQTIVTVLVLGALVHWVGWRDLLEGLSAARGPWLGAMYLTALLNFVVLGRSLQGLLAKAGLRVGLGRVLLANAVANYYSLILPGDLMAGVSKWAFLSAATGRKARVLSAMLLNKLALAMPPLLFGTAAFAFENPFPELPIAPVAAAAGLVALGGALVALHPRSAAPADRALRRLARPLPAPLRKALGALLDAFGAFRDLTARDLAEVLGLALLAFAVGLVGFFCATRALGFGVPVSTLAWISLALFLARLLPVTFNNLGVREGLLVLALGGSEVAPALAVGVGLLMFSNAILLAGVGAVGQLAIVLGWTSLGPGSPARAGDGGP